MHTRCGSIETRWSGSLGRTKIPRRPECGCSITNTDAPFVRTLRTCGGYFIPLEPSSPAARNRRADSDATTYVRMQGDFQDASLVKIAALLDEASRRSFRQTSRRMCGVATVVVADRKRRVRSDPWLYLTIQPCTKLRMKTRPRSGIIREPFPCNAMVVKMFTPHRRWRYRPGPGEQYLWLFPCVCAEIEDERQQPSRRRPYPCWRDELSDEQ